MHTHRLTNGPPLFAPASVCAWSCCPGMHTPPWADPPPPPPAADSPDTNGPPIATSLTRVLCVNVHATSFVLVRPSLVLALATSSACGALVFPLPPPPRRQQARSPCLQPPPCPAPGWQEPPALPPLRGPHRNLPRPHVPPPPRLHPGAWAGWGGRCRGQPWCAPWRQAVAAPQRAPGHPPSRAGAGAASGAGQLGSAGGGAAAQCVLGVRGQHGTQCVPESVPGTPGGGSR
jgi:hypothetical protein